jgi:hypothetical protein
MNPSESNEPHHQLSFFEEEPGDASQNIQRDDSLSASIEKSALGNDHTLIEAIVDEPNMETAWARVKANHGAPGPDGVTVEDFPEWFRPQW